MAILVYEVASIPLVPQVWWVSSCHSISCLCRVGRARLRAKADSHC